MVNADVATFERHVAEATPEALEQAAAIYGGDLLSGFTLNEPLFEEWLVPERERLRELALEALAKLHAARLLDAGRHEEFYVRLSAIVRTYLEARFRLRAPEMTTEEFLQAAQRDPQLTPPQRSLLGTFLAEADLVKFARYVPAADDAERAYRAAREFVQSTVPPEVPRAAA